MKRFLSVMLAAMMLLSGFAINASAMISTTYTVIEGATDEVEYLKQDFSDASKLDFSAGSYGSTSVADGAVTLSTPSSDILHVSSPAVVSATNWTIEFDVRRNSDFATSSYYGLTFLSDKAAYEDDATKIENKVDDYGVYVPLMHNDKGVWYTYRFTFDEQAVADAIVDLGTAGYDNKYATYLITKAEYKKATDTTWTTIATNGSWNATGATVRPLIRHQGRGYNFSGYTVDGVATENEMSFTFHTPHSSYKSTAEEIAAANFSLDNIRAYVEANPGEAVQKEYSIVGGTVALTAETANYPDAYAGATTYKGNIYTTKFTAPAEGGQNVIVTTFDARNTVKGMPLCIHIGGAAKNNAVSILSKDSLDDAWYTYKVYCIETSNGMSIEKVYRKPAEGTGVFEEVVLVGKNDDVTNADVWASGSPSSANNEVRVMYVAAASGHDARHEQYAYPGATLTDTKWEVRNLQVTSGAVVVGEAKADSGVVTVDAEIAAATAPATPVLAIYDTNDILVDIDFVNVAGGEGSAELSADYASGNTAKILVWDGLSTGNPLLVDALDITSKIK